MSVGHKIIVEGCDNCGKSHYIEGILKEHPNYKVIHCTRLTPNTYEYFKELLLSEEDIIFDRFCYGQFIYQTASERADREWLTIDQLIKLESIILDYEFKVVYVHTRPEVAYHLCQKDKQDSYYTIDYIEDIMRRYEYFFKHISIVNPVEYFNDYRPEDLLDIPEEVDYANFDYDSLPKVVAVDFDGTLVYGAKFPEIGKLNTKLVNELFGADGKYRDYRKILFTHRSGQCLVDACNFLADNGLHFDAINDDDPEVKKLLNRNPIDNRKIWFDIIIDDKADCSDIIYK